MLGDITTEEIRAVSEILSRWSGCIFSLCAATHSVADPTQGPRAWIAAKDSNGLVNYIAFSDEGLIPHG
jgi:hypothetical protein